MTLSFQMTLSFECCLDNERGETLGKGRKKGSTLVTSTINGAQYEIKMMSQRVRASYRSHGGNGAN